MLLKRSGRFVLFAGLLAVGALAALAWASARRTPSPAPQVPLLSEPAPPPAPPPRAATPSPAPAPADKPVPARAARRAGEADGTGDRVPDESAQMAKIRAAVRGNPEQALALIDAADQAHGDGRHAEERAALRIDALVFANRVGVARDFAEAFLRRYPLSPYAGHVETLTGVHPRPPEP
jgi:hypothetical protein